MSHSARLAVIVPLTLTLSLAAGRQLSAEGNRVVPHVRGADALSRELLETATRKSSTVSALIATLDGSDVIVYVGAGWLPVKVKGTTQVVVSTPVVRYLRIVLKLPNTKEDMLEVLGHELQHAVEIAAMAEVRDELSHAAAYRRIGYATSRGGFFETKAAIKTGRLVAREALKR